MLMARQSRVAVAVLLALFGWSCRQPPAAPSGTSTPPAQATRPIRVLMLTATAGFRHDSITTAQQVMVRLARASGEFTVTSTEQVSIINAAALAAYDVVFFALTSGELEFSDDQKAALVNFVAGGAGFLGVHSASDTLYGWPEYGTLVGAYFKEHPWTQQGTVIVEDQSHPATSGLGERFSLPEEFYTFRENPRPRVQVLLRLDPVSVGSTGDYPLAWAHGYGNGRVYYNALGHFSSTWDDSRFQQQLIGAIRWAAQPNGLH
jgi:type 1 glutamine amidotransferase